MIKLENTQVMNLENALRGMRNPLDSWSKTDTVYTPHEAILGENDKRLALALANAGPTHRKYLRQIFVSVDITAPLYWWKEFDTYKVGTTANSQSTMHTIHKKQITPALFSVDYLNEVEMERFSRYCEYLDRLRCTFVATKDVRYWNKLIQLLPSSFNQLRTVTLNYEVLVNMYDTRKNHKLVEWHKLCSWIEKLPNSELITFNKKKEQEKERV